VNQDLSEFISNIWRYKPVIIVLGIGGFIIFVLLVIDTFRHRKKQKKRHPKKY
jgi:hypothetical protein